MTLWQRLLALLAWASAEPSALEAERPRAAAAVAVAYASLMPPQPTPAEDSQPECKTGKCPEPQSVLKR